LVGGESSLFFFKRNNILKLNDLFKLENAKLVYKCARARVYLIMSGIICCNVHGTAKNVYHRTRVF